MLTQEQILEALRAVKYPGFSRDIISFGLVKEIGIEGGALRVRMEITTADPNTVRIIEEESKKILEALPGVKALTLKIDVKAPLQAAMQAGGAPKNDIPGVKHVIAVASGKGGVGKSTVATNLALALKARGLKVGLCDCDLYGPSIGLMMGVTERPTITEDDKINPIEKFGLRLMSMSFLIEPDAAVVLRGPMVTRYTQQFLRDVKWGELDVLVLDLPPGTGDIQLTIVQTVALAGAVVVTTPQEVALIDARKAAAMFHKVSVPILGLVENMSYFLCPDNGKRYDIFGTGGGRREADRLNVPLLGEIPLDIAARGAGDQGRPIVDADPQNPVSRAFLDAAAQLEEVLRRRQDG